LFISDFGTFRYTRICRFASDTPLLVLNPGLEQGGGWLGSPSCTPPHIREFFSPYSPYMTSVVFS